MVLRGRCVRVHRSADPEAQTVYKEGAGGGGTCPSWLEYARRRPVSFVTPAARRPVQMLGLIADHGSVPRRSRSVSPGSLDILRRAKTHAQRSPPPSHRDPRNPNKSLCLGVSVAQLLCVSQAARLLPRPARTPKTRRKFSRVRMGRNCGITQRRSAGLQACRVWRTRADCFASLAMTLPVIARSPIGRRSNLFGQYPSLRGAR